MWCSVLFFTLKTAYELRISDWSSDVCSSDLSWYLAAEGMDEDGWRDHSPSEVRQLFGKFAWTTDTTVLALTLAHADNDLIGNGLIPEGMYEIGRASCRERVCQSTQIAVVAVSFTKQTIHSTLKTYSYV